MDLSAGGFVRRDITHIDLHFPVQSIVEKEVVRHADPVGFHGMALSIVVVPHVPLERKDYPDIVYTTKFARKPAATMHLGSLV